MDQNFDDKDRTSKEKDPSYPKKGRNSSNKKKKKKKRHWSLWIILILLIIIACLLAYNHYNNSKSQTPIESSIIKNRLTVAQDLTSVKYLYTNLGAFEQQKDFQGIKLPFTKKKFLVRYDGIISAGINLKDMKIDIEGNVIHIKLPEAKILSHELDEDSFEVFDEENSIFNPFSVSDFQEFQKKLKEEREEEAIKNGILVQAQQKAGTVIREILLTNPEISENYQIDIH